MLLADMGAEVIKVEEPGKGDDTRAWPAFAGGESTYFMSVNRGKKSLTLDLKADAGKTVLRKLLAGADVLLENFRPGTLARLGFGWDAVHALNPRLVSCSISGFGESGPEASRPGYDLIVQGESGVMDLTGFPDGPPVKVGNSIADLASGTMAAHGVVLALLARERTGAGQRKSSKPRPTIPPAGFKSLSTRSRIVIAAVCQPLAANPRKIEAFAARSSR